MYTNEQIAKQFEKLALLLEFLSRNDPSDTFRIRTYKNIANIIRTYNKNIYKEFKNWTLDKIPWFGKETWAKLLEFLQTWTISSYERLKKNIPESVLDIMDVPWIWPKLAKQLYEKLNIKSIKDLQNLLEKEPEKILSLPRMWEKKLEQIKKGFEMYQFTKTRTPLGIIYPYAQSLLKEILNFEEVEKAVIAGSLRRMKETIWDIDILALSKNPALTMKNFKVLENVEQVIVSGDTKTSVFLKFPHIQVDLRIVEKESFWSALQYFTGSKQHNIHVRKIALEKGYKLSEYGIFQKETDKKIWWENEKDIYKILWMEYIEPEIRQDIWEIDLALKNKLPKLIEYNSLKWDLHVHSNWSDGKNTIEELVQTAISLNYKYIAITDHSQSLSIANGLDEKRFLKKLEEVKKIRKKYPQIKILMWTEVDILQDGSLDYPEEILKKCDIVIASIHRWFSQDQTERYLKALDNPYITMIWHPSWRVFWEREEMKVDWEKVFKKAIEKNVAMEINSQPLRLDLPVHLIRQFDKMWWYFYINTDAHSLKCLKEYSKYGISQARRAMLWKNKILNA